MFRIEDSSQRQQNDPKCHHLLPKLHGLNPKDHSLNTEIMLKLLEHTKTGSKHSTKGVKRFPNIVVEFCGTLYNTEGDDSSQDWSILVLTYPKQL